MNPGAQPFRRYDRWTKTSASDQNRLRAAVEDLSRAAVSEGTAQQIIAGVPVTVPAQPDEFWILIQGPPKGNAYVQWVEVVQNGTGGFVVPADPLRGNGGFIAYELYSRRVPVTNVPCRAWLSQSEPLCAVFDGTPALSGDAPAEQEVSLWCNCTTGPLVLQDQDRVSAVIALGGGIFRVIFSVTFLSPEHFEWSGNCKSNAYLFEVDRTAFSVTVQASSLVDPPRWGIDARGHIGAASYGSASGGTVPPGQRITASGCMIEIDDQGGATGPPTLTGQGQSQFSDFYTYQLTFAGQTVPAGATLVWAVALRQLPALAASPGVSGAFSGAAGPGDYLQIGGVYSGSGSFPDVTLMVTGWVNQTGADVTGDIVETILLEVPRGSVIATPSAVLRAALVPGAVSPYIPSGTPQSRGSGPPAAVGPWSASLENPPRCAAVLAFMASTEPIGEWSNGFTDLGEVGRNGVELSMAGAVGPEADSYTAVNDGSDGIWVMKMAVLLG
jgi:hypothetical protein